MQKFSCRISTAEIKLRTQLREDASHVISGFPLSDANYAQSKELLKGTFGQKFNLVDLHMDALLKVSPPTNILASLQFTACILQSHIRALPVLGKSPQSYGPLLTASVLVKFSLTFK